MKALNYPNWGALEIEEIPKPVPRDGEVLIRVSHCGICGSELDTFRSRSLRRTPPLIMGHEFCGWVEHAGNASSHWKKGMPVIAHAIVHCGHCNPCKRGDTNLCSSRGVFGMHRQGAFAEYVSVPEQVLIPWPEVLSPVTAIFAEPLANGVNAMRQNPTGRKSRVVILGAGPIGLMCLYAAKRLYDASVIISDRVPERLAVARTLGADHTVNVYERDIRSEVRDYWNGEPGEHVIDAVGTSETKTASIDLVEPAGTAVWVGLHEDRIEFDTYPLTLQQKTICGTYSGSMSDLHTAVQILEKQPFDTSWVSTSPIEAGEAAFEALLRDGRNVKTILHFSQSELQDK